ncbi:MAG: LysM peptidoglycan-binding domain-containing protein [Anaerolineae bacterium]|nr:LysM peptidoglycan-binding domain-containing protein [Anaerolineae bacterium]
MPGLLRASFRLLLLLSLLVLTLSGCFRPAGESILPTSPLTVAVTPQSSVSDGEGVNSDTATADLNDTPSPTENPLSSSAVPATLGQAEGNSMPSGSQMVTLVIVTNPAIVATFTPQFITPGVSLGFTTPDTPSPIEISQTAFAPLVGRTSTPSGLITPTSMFGIDEACLYVVEPGDSLFAIANREGFTVEEIVAENPELTGDPPVIYPGDQLRLPGCEDDIASQTGDSVTIGTRIPTVAPFRGATATAGQTAGGQTVHVVQSGDTLSVIAQRYSVTVAAIVQANNLSNPNALQIGQQLIIPDGQ